MAEDARSVGVRERHRDDVADFQRLYIGPDGFDEANGLVAHPATGAFRSAICCSARPMPSAPAMKRRGGGIAGCESRFRELGAHAAIGTGDEPDLLLGHGVRTRLRGLKLHVTPACLLALCSCRC